MQKLIELWGMARIDHVLIEIEQLTRISEFSENVQKEYKRRHDWVGKVIRMPVFKMKNI